MFHSELPLKFTFSSLRRVILITFLKEKKHLTFLNNQSRQLLYLLSIAFSGVFCTIGTRADFNMGSTSMFHFSLEYLD